MPIYFNNNWFIDGSWTSITQKLNNEKKYLSIITQKGSAGKIGKLDHANSEIIFDYMTKNKKGSHFYLGSAINLNLKNIFANILSGRQLLSWNDMRT